MLPIPGRVRRLTLHVGIVIGTVLMHAVPPLAPTAEASTANIYTTAGTGVGSDTGDGGQATEAQIRLPRSIFPVSPGGYIFAEPFSHIVRLVDVNGIITTVAGNGTAGFSGDGGSAKTASLNFVHSASPTSNGGFLLADTLNHRIRRVSSAGTITTVAGNGVAGYSGDGGAAMSAQINNPRGVVALADGGFLIADSNNHRIRRVSLNGTITTVAGTGIPGAAGDAGQATSAQLSLPFGVVPASDNGFLIVDTGNDRVRRVAGDGTIRTIAGNGSSGYNGDGIAATSASLNKPHNAAFQSDGGVLIADRSNERVRRVDAGGSISTLAGNGVAGFGGDGVAATDTHLNAPKAVTEIAGGSTLLADESNNRIRFVGTPVAPTSSILPTITGLPRTGQSLTAFAGGWRGTGPVIRYQWRRCPRRNGTCSDIVAATGKTYAPVGADVGKTLLVRVSASNAAGTAEASSARSRVVR